MNNKNKSNNKNNSNSIVKMRGGAGGIGGPPIPPPIPPRIPPPLPPSPAPIDYNEIHSPNNILKENLFQIINEKINDIVENLKKRLGPNIRVTNENARDIMNMLNSFSNSINNHITTNITQQEDNIIITGTDGNKTTMKSNTYYDKFQTDIKNNANINAMGSIDSPNAGRFNYATVPDTTLNLSRPDDINILENRLINCQNLEMLYLIKHDELMTTFAFTLNLFDKYKYSIKIVLFLLKNLVYKQEKPGGKTETVKLPGVKLPGDIIKKIGLLVKDQGVVQGVIEQMKKTLIDAPSSDTDPKGLLQKLTTKIHPPLPDEQNLNNGIGNVNTPQPRTL